MLMPYGSLDNTAAEHPDRVQNLQTAGLSELARRGDDPLLINWLKNVSEGQMPDSGLLITCVAIAFILHFLKAILHNATFQTSGFPAPMIIEAFFQWDKTNWQ